MTLTNPDGTQFWINMDWVLRIMPRGTGSYVEYTTGRHAYTLPVKESPEEIVAETRALRL